MHYFLYFLGQFLALMLGLFKFLLSVNNKRCINGYSMHTFIGTCIINHAKVIFQVEMKTRTCVTITHGSLQYKYPYSR